MTEDERDGALSPAPVPGPPRTRLAKRLARPLWILARPVVRPLAWRTRTFLLEMIRQDLAELRAGQAQLAATQAQLAAGQERLEAALAALARQTSESGPLAEQIGGIAATLESALLTIAVPVCPAAKEPQPEPPRKPAREPD